MSRKLETTKRNIFKISLSIYDPLGIVSPVTALKQFFKFCVEIKWSGMC